MRISGITHSIATRVVLYLCLFMLLTTALFINYNHNISSNASITVLLTVEISKFICLALVIGVSFYVVAVRHLRQIELYLRNMSGERFAQPLSISRYPLLEAKHDELSRLVAAINSMQITIKQQLAEKKSVEAALEAQWELLNIVLANIPSAIFWKDNSCRYLGCNDNFARDANLASADDVIGKTDYDLPWTKQQAAIFHDLDIKIIHSASPLINVESEQMQLATGMATILMSKVPLLSQSGNIVGTLGIYTDISDLKRAESEIRYLNEELERKVTHRTMQLKESNLELEQALVQLEQAQDQLVQSGKMVALGNLVVGIAEEICIPIGTGASNACLLAAQLSELADKLENKTLNKNDISAFINTSLELSETIMINLEAAAAQIRGFKQIAVDQSSEKKRLFNVKQYLQEILLSLDYSLKQTKHKLTLTCPEDLDLYGIAGAFSQIITNLITNSLLHGYDEHTAGKLRIDVTVDESKLTIVYQDDGKGIEPQHLPQIFEPSFTTKQGRGDSGLGLHILYNSVTQVFGGEVECASEPGCGVCFTITIPLKNVIDNQAIA